MSSGPGFPPSAEPGPSTTPLAPAHPRQETDVVSSAGHCAPDRRTLVPGARLTAWRDRFAASHGGITTEHDETGLWLDAADGARALLQPPWPDAGRPGRGEDDVARMAQLAQQSRVFAAILIRRSGYVVGICTGGRVTASKTGSRYVQSRTAAGGWSQQRYARRRGNQADELVRTVAGHAANLDLGSAEYLLLGGDAPLAEAVLAAPEMRRLRQLKRLQFLPVKQPNRAALERAARNACSVRISVWDARGSADRPQ